mgnify:CR=1 FL=1
MAAHFVPGRTLARVDLPPEADELRGETRRWLEANAPGGEWPRDFVHRLAAQGYVVHLVRPLTGGVSSDIWRIDTPRGPVCAKRALSAAKELIGRAGRYIGQQAIQLHGGFGFTDEYAVSRLYRGARYGTLGGGTTETLRDLIGKRIMDAADAGAELLAYDMMNGG